MAGGARRHIEGRSLTRLPSCGGRREAGRQCPLALSLGTDLWERDDRGDFIWTVEHIFPQGPNIPPTWVKMIAGGDEEKARDFRDRYAHQLGNLTITGYNSKLGNKSFEDKRDRKDSRGKYVGYMNGLYLNEGLAKAKSWTVQDIQARTGTLVAMALKLFSLD